MAASAIVLTMLTACGQDLGAPPSPGGGQVAGRLVSQTSNGSNRAAAGGVRVGAFTTAVSGGPVMQHPGQPVASATTSSDGLCVIKGLEPGTYFITATRPGPIVAGTWVRVTDGQGASVLLVRCTDCPVPLQGSG